MLSFEFVIKDLLDTLGFEEAEQKEYLDKFTNNLNAQSIKDLISTLPEEKQSELLNSQELEVEIKNHFTDEEIESSFKESARKSVDAYLREISPSLSKDQLIKLGEFSKRLKQELPDSF